MCLSVLPECASVYHVHILPTETGKGCTKKNVGPPGTEFTNNSCFYWGAEEDGLEMVCVCVCV